MPFISVFSHGVVIATILVASNHENLIAGLGGLGALLACDPAEYRIVRVGRNPLFVKRVGAPG